MSRFIATSVAAVALTLAGTGAASAAVLSYYASMTGPSESPANASPAVGYGTVVIDTTAHTMTLAVTFSGLTGNTTASHIQRCWT